MVTERIDRTNDAVFKAVFAKHPQITLSLINSFFEFQGTEQIADIEFIDREIDGVLPDDKESRLDILGRTSTGVKVNIEVQVNALQSMGERSLSICSIVSNIRTCTAASASMIQRPAAS